MKENWPIINTSNFNKKALLEFEQNEKAIKKLLRISKKSITSEQQEELKYRVWNRPNIIRRFKEK